MSERTVVSRNPIPSYIPKESEIQHVVFEAGEEAYHNRPSGPKNYNYKINVNATELEVLVSDWISQLRCMVKLLDADDYINFGENFDTVLKAFDQEMDEALNAVYENIGWIYIHQVGITRSSWREGRVVGAELKPKDHLLKEGVS